MKAPKLFKERPPLSPDRAAVLAGIEEKERLGGEAFFENVENDPDHPPLTPDMVDYLCKKPASKLRRRMAYAMRARMSKMAKAHYNMQVVGEENLKGLENTGLIFTSNHFSPFESEIVRMASLKVGGKHRFHAVTREGNFFMEGPFGFLLKYCDTLPLSQDVGTMRLFSRAVSTLLEEKAHILIYPEQSMWFHYRKPRPLREGPFRIAAKQGVPVVPCFVTLHDCGDWEENGMPHVHYTLHILPPLFPDPEKSVRENSREMLSRNQALTRQVYEETYGVPLTFSYNEHDGGFLGEE